MEYLKHCSSIEIDGAIQIAHRPWIAPINYAIHIFPPAKKAWIRKFKEKKIPEVYQQFLLTTNGLFAFSISLYGLPPSMQKTPPLLDRSRLQCLDLFAANTHWVREYKTDQELFLFGGREFSDTEIIGYFMLKDAKVRAIRKTGEVLQEWDTFQSFFASEIYLAEQKSRQITDQGWWE